ncbi:MAG: hypothetical protein JJT78_16935 [Leptospira sp.]|nr:hypothetical protein [Leptospira sp.]
MKKQNLMRLILIFYVNGILFCSPQETNRDRNRLIQTGALLYLIERSYSNPPLDSSECSQWSRTNREFNNRYEGFLSDKKEYKNLILGDSTMDISGRYPEFLKPNLTQNLAVGGNNLCDINRQMFAINTTNPENILLSTSGGIDILQDLSLENRIRSMELLMEKIKDRFTDANISVVAVHPTQIDLVNNQRSVHNQAMREVAESSWESFQLCWIDPLPLFGEGDLNSTDSAPNENMIQFPNGEIDPVHYNRDISFALKTKLEENCNLYL